jgi:hypothetical protein
MNDIIVLDNVLPTITQNRLKDYVSSEVFEWNDYNHVQTAGFYFKDFTFESDATTVPSDSMIKLVYYNNFIQSKIFDRTLYWLGMAVIDEYQQKTGDRVDTVMRMKVNNQKKSIVPGYDQKCCNEIHVDNFEHHKTLIYYINDSDGDTFLFDKLYTENTKDYKLETFQRVTPKQGRVVCFNGRRFHAPSNPLFYNRRFILNINFI